jgi:hypothetical protein
MGRPATLRATSTVSEQAERLLPTFNRCQPITLLDVIRDTQQMPR